MYNISYVASFRKYRLFQSIFILYFEGNLINVVFFMLFAGTHI